MDLVTKEIFDKMVEAYEEKTKILEREIELLKAEKTVDDQDEERKKESGLSGNTYDMLQQLTRGVK
ncbi:hypothetical protein [Ruoffia sp. FAM 20858]|uniref:hypothetical protein n=1 Tax=Ruoffia sp. FAM 20858 TaxID=3259516 RepID=UPI00388801E0